MNNPEMLSDDMMANIAGGTLTREEALEKALEHANIDKKDVDLVKKVELDYEHGRKIYEIEFYNNGYEYEYDVDAETGKILKFDKDFD